MGASTASPSILRQSTGAANVGRGGSTVDDDLTALETDKAPLASPALTGAPTTPTAAPGTNTTQVSTTAFVQAAIAAILDSTPATLDTLNELAAALGDDANYAATTTAAIALKVAITDIVNNLTSSDTNKPLSALQGKNLQDLKAALASPTFTGIAAAPTASPGTNTTQLATTAFVQAGLPSAASQAEAEAASEAAKYLSPDNAQYHPGVAKMWAKVNYVGSTLIDSHNVTSHTDDTNGKVTITIDTDFSSVDYVAIASAGYYTTRINAETRAVGSLQLVSVAISDDSTTDPGSQGGYFVAVFGDQ